MNVEIWQKGGKFQEEWWIRLNSLSIRSMINVPFTNSGIGAG